MSTTKMGKETRDIRLQELPRIREFFDLSEDETAVMERGLDIRPTSSEFTLAQVAGTVEAGAFREVDDFDQSEPREFAVPVDRQFPNARVLIFEVAGDSMDALKPQPILSGSHAVCLAFEDIEHLYPIRSGMVVIIERTRESGHLREWSIKQIEFFEDRVEFHPRSNNKRHDPIVIDRNLLADDGTQVQIIGLVRYSINQIPYL